MKDMSKTERRVRKVVEKEAKRVERLHSCTECGSTVYKNHRKKCFESRIAQWKHLIPSEHHSQLTELSRRKAIELINQGPTVLSAEESIAILKGIQTQSTVIGRKINATVKDIDTANLMNTQVSRSLKSRLVRRVDESQKKKHQSMDILDELLSKSKKDQSDGQVKLKTESFHPGIETNGQLTRPLRRNDTIARIESDNKNRAEMLHSLQSNLDTLVDNVTEKKQHTQGQFELAVCQLNALSKQLKRNELNSFRTMINQSRVDQSEQQHKRDEVVAAFGSGMLSPAKNNDQKIRILKNKYDELLSFLTVRNGEMVVALGKLDSVIDDTHETIQLLKDEYFKGNETNLDTLRTLSVIQQRLEQCDAVRRLHTAQPQSADREFRFESVFLSQKQLLKEGQMTDLVSIWKTKFIQMEQRLEEEQLANARLSQTVRELLAKMAHKQT